MTFCKHVFTSTVLSNSEASSATLVILVPHDFAASIFSASQRHNDDRSESLHPNTAPRYFDIWVYNYLRRGS